MPIPTPPTNLLARPFAANGTYQIPPDAKATEGRASLQEGFPTETQLPLTAGGIAPNRLDFNGILYLLSSLAFWQQSGGEATWNATLNYQKPNMVFYNNVLWWCVTGSGPETSAGAITPGSNSAYWIDIGTMVDQMRQGQAAIGTPVGGIVIWPTATVPTGFFECNGQGFSASTYPLLTAALGATTVPDMRGLFVRGYDPSGANDPEGQGRAIRSYQGDAIRNIIGNFSNMVSYSPSATGAFSILPVSFGGRLGAETTTVAVDFVASRVVPTANENRPKNLNMMYIIKHD